MARIPILQDPQQINTGNQTAQTARLPAVTNAALGEALGNVASVAFDISEKAKRANDVTKLTEASLAMNQAQVEFAAWQQSPEGQNEKDWLPKWQELQNGIKSRFDQESLSPDARLQLADRFSSWGTRGTIMVQANAFKQAGQRMDATGQLAKRKAIETGDTAPFKEFLNNRAAAGLSQGPEFDAVEYAQVEDALKSKRISELRDQIPELTRLGYEGDREAWVTLKGVNDQIKDLGGLDPDNYKIAQKQADRGELESLIKERINGTKDLPVDLTRAKKLIDGSDLPPQTKGELENEIVRAKSRYANQDILNFMNNVVSGAATDGDDFTSQYMEPAELAEARAKINEAIPVSPESEARMYLDTMVMIDGLDPNLVKEQNPAEVIEFAKAALAVKKAPPHLRNRLADALQAKLAGKDEKSAAADGAKLGREMLQTIIKSKEAEFFQGEGADRKLNPTKVAEWMKFQQKVFNMEREIDQRVKGVEDFNKINEIVSSVVSAEYVKAKKDAHYTPSGSGFIKEVPATEFDGPYRIPMPASGPVVPLQNPFLPSFNAFQQ